MLRLLDGVLETSSDDGASLTVAGYPAEMPMAHEE